MPVKMFLYFGYVDEELAGLKNAVTLYRMAEAMSDHSDIGVYTFYDWLMAIFRGQNLPAGTNSIRIIPTISISRKWAATLLMLS